MPDNTKLLFFSTNKQRHYHGSIFKFSKVLITLIRPASDIIIQVFQVEHTHRLLLVIFLFNSQHNKYRKYKLYVASDEIQILDVMLHYRACKYIHRSFFLHLYKPFMFMQDMSNLGFVKYVTLKLPFHHFSSLKIYITHQKLRSISQL